MTYSVKEIFYTLQGEGLRAGRPAVFCRFAGCNLWSGREEDRSEAQCQFCDTDFVGTNGTLGGKYDADGLARQIAALWPALPQATSTDSTSPDPMVPTASATDRAIPAATPYVVLTGGEPMLQVDLPLIAALHARGFEVAVETNGTLPVPRGPTGIDWVCVSPKAGTPWVQRSGDELKLVFPQPTLMPAAVEQALADQPGAFRYWLLQAMDGPLQGQHLQQAIAHCQARPHWRLSVQTHKVLQIR